MNNYEKQAEAAKKHFLEYDGEALARKNHLKLDADYLYPVLLGQAYRISRKDGSVEKQQDGIWNDGNSFEEVMTLLDLVCDSKEQRSCCGRWKTMESFGLTFHRGLLEARDPAADRFSKAPEKLEKACQMLAGTPIPGADIGYAVELFDGLKIGLQFWDGDEEFFPRLRYLWDENALLYLRYETMFYAVSLLQQRVEAVMDSL